MTTLALSSVKNWMVKVRSTVNYKKELINVLLLVLQVESSKPIYIKEWLKVVKIKGINPTKFTRRE